MKRSKSFFSHEGFTLIEMLISIAIFTTIVVAFIGILLAITNIGGQQSSASAVGQESQTLLSKIQYYVETASLVNIPTSTTTSTLQLFMASSSADPTFITLATSTGVVYLQQTTTGTLQALTSNRVFVSALSFTRQANPPGHDVVNVSFTMQNKAGLTNIAQSFGRLFQSSIVHVSAATFDTGVFSSAATEPLGTSANLWSPINSYIYTLSNGNVGINQPSPAQPFEVNGGVRLNPTSATQPTCGSSYGSLGTLWFSPGGGGAGALYICNTNASGTYAWHQITTN
jgi:prepilin-type N-terminal cleavage/methylation domain-containing protein